LGSCSCSTRCQCRHTRAARQPACQTDRQHSCWQQALRLETAAATAPYLAVAQCPRHEGSRARISRVLYVPDLSSCRPAALPPCRPSGTSLYSPLFVGRMRIDSCSCSTGPLARSRNPDARACEKKRGAVPNAGNCRQSSSSFSPLLSLLDRRTVTTLQPDTPR
jgi:hypothetical protein